MKIFHLICCSILLSNCTVRNHNFKNSQNISISGSYGNFDAGEFDQDIHFVTKNELKQIIIGGKGYWYSKEDNDVISGSRPISYKVTIYRVDKILFKTKFTIKGNDVRKELKFREIRDRLKDYDLIIFDKILVIREGGLIQLPPATLVVKD